MELGKDKSVLNDFNEAIRHEWLETNGLGGWAGSSIIGCHTRRYHGLLVAATIPPTERMVMVSKLDETIIVDDKRYELGTNNYGEIIAPAGNRLMTRFSRKIFPEWTYEFAGIILKKTISMVQDSNTTIIAYDILQAPKPFSIEWLPLIAARGYHALQHADQNIFWNVEFENGLFRNRPYEGAPEIFISIPGSGYSHDPKWYYHFNYEAEKSRGLDCVEDLFNHGTIHLNVKEGDSIGILISTEDPRKKDWRSLMDAEFERKQSLLRGNPNELAPQLRLAADQFIVRRGRNQKNEIDAGHQEFLKTVIAGYHWFTDWARDTMISLPGLCIATGRLDDAKKILETFAESVSMGMLPNRFQDNQEPPEYNNVDGTLWFFVAVYKYLQGGGDHSFVLQKILPILGNIIDWHYKGTRYQIHVDDDGLLFAGEEGQQLTWMDARIGNWVVTPRKGKPVEIQALWYNALRIYGELLILNREDRNSGKILGEARKTKENFLRSFWNPDKATLHDVIDEKGNPDPTIRPNQLFSISLPFPLLDGEIANAILETVDKNLYTSVGLKTLPSTDTRYVPIYEGDPFHRDSCYHQGTVWAWLLGPFVDAIMKIRGPAGKEWALAVIDRFRFHLNEACIGSASEIFDADSPHTPRGAVAQAWSVAEILRVVEEYNLHV